MVPLPQVSEWPNPMAGVDNGMFSGIGNGTGVNMTNPMGSGMGNGTGVNMTNPISSDMGNGIGNSFTNAMNNSISNGMLGLGGAGDNGMDNAFGVMTGVKDGNSTFGSIEDIQNIME